MSFTINLEYTFLIDPKADPQISTFYETNYGLWTEFREQTRSYRMVDNLKPLNERIAQINHNEVLPINHISLIANSLLMTVSIEGTQDFVNQSKMEILQTYNQIKYKSVLISEEEFLKINETFTNQLLKLSNQYGVEFIINNKKLDGMEKGTSTYISTSSGPSSSGLSSESSSPSSSYPISPSFFIHMIGNQDNIGLVESLIKILIATLLNNEYLDAIDIELSMIPLAGGVDFFNFNQISNQSCSKMYIPDLLPNLFNSNHVANTKDSKIYITSKSIPEILLTKSILMKLIKKQQIIVNDVEIDPMKITSMILNNQQDIIKIMFKYGVFIQFPSLGEEAKVTVQGCTLEAINDAIYDLNLLSTSFYSIQIQDEYSGSHANPHFSHTHTSTSLPVQLIQSRKSCIITSTDFGYNITGSDKEIKQLLFSLSSSSINFKSIRLRFELNHDQRDFISGKKNGKLIKVLNQLNQLPTIQFKPFNGYNFYIDFEISEGISLSVLMKGLELLEMEMPSELRFNIPEVFHKSIIGNGGSIIQSIMKKYNVFIKFSSIREGSQRNIDSPAPTSMTTSPTFYSFKRFNNVLIKCPRKNSANIKLVKYEIDQLVYQCCMSSNNVISMYHNVQFKLLKSHYLLLINHNKLSDICSMEQNFNSFINFPSSMDTFRDNQFLMDIKGSELKSKECFKHLKAILPQNYEFRIAFNSSKFHSTFNYDFTQRVVIPFRLLLGIEVLVCEVPVTKRETPCHQIILSYYENEGLNSAINELTTFLRENEFLILEKSSLEFDPSTGADLSQIREQVYTHQTIYQGTKGRNHQGRNQEYGQNPQTIVDAKYQYQDIKHQNTIAPKRRQFQGYGSKITSQAGPYPPQVLGQITNINNNVVSKSGTAQRAPKKKYERFDFVKPYSEKKHIHYVS